MSEVENAMMEEQDVGLHMESGLPWEAGCFFKELVSPPFPAEAVLLPTIASALAVHSGVWVGVGVSKPGS